MESNNNWYKINNDMSFLRKWQPLKGLLGWLLLLFLRGDGSNLLLFRLLGEKDSLDVGKDTTLSDGDSREELV